MEPGTINSIVWIIQTTMRIKDPENNPDRTDFHETPGVSRAKVQSSYLGGGLLLLPGMTGLIYLAMSSGYATATHNCKWGKIGSIEIKKIKF